MENHVAKVWRDEQPGGYFVVEYIHPPRWNDFEGQRFYFTAKD